MCSFLKQHLGASGPEAADVEALKLEVTELRQRTEQLNEENNDLKSKVRHRRRHLITDNVLITEFDMVIRSCPRNGFRSHKCSVVCFSLHSTNRHRKVKQPNNETPSIQNPSNFCSSLLMIDIGGTVLVQLLHCNDFCKMSNNFDVIIST